VNRPQSLSLREVADRAGVAMSSVSRVLTDHPDVSPAMRARVMAVVSELGYEPNLLASSLRRGSTLTVGFVVRDISSPLFSEIVLGAETHLREAGYAMLLTNSEGSSELDVAHINLFRRRRVDGLLLSLADESDTDTLAEIQRLQIPFVLIDRELKDAPEASAVLCDHASAMWRVTEHLHELGHRRIALVAGPLSVRPSRELKHSFEAACDKLSIDCTVESGAFSETHGEEASMRLLGGRDRPTALISGFNQVLPGVMRAIRAHALRIPEDVSLVTFDDVPMLEFVDPPIATVSREPQIIGQAAAALLLARLNGEPPGTEEIPTYFNPRASCGPAPVRRTGQAKRSS
jgi:LacI family transcriptional regulator, galactose operon repressor